MTFNLVGGAAEAVLSEVANIRERFVERVLREIVVFEIAPEIIQGILDGDQRRGGLVLPLRILGVIPDDDADARKYAVGPDCADMRRVGFDIPIKCLRLGQRVLMGKMASAWRAANFLPSSDAPAENNRSTLRRAGNI